MNKNAGFLIWLVIMSAIFIMGILTGRGGGKLPSILAGLFGLSFVYVLLYAFDWLPKRKENRGTSSKQNLQNEKNHLHR
ncbi:MAG: hypothetical protein ACM32O_20980 [Clostridia bacterium]